MIRYDLRRLLPRSAIVALCLVCFGAFHTPVNAAFGHAQSSSGWGVDWKYGYMGPSPQWTPATTGVSGGGAAWTHGPSGVAGSANGRISNGPSYIDVNARVVPTSASTAAALGRFARKALPVLGTAVALRDLIDELGFQSPDGVTWQKRDPSICTVAPCYEYQGFAGMNGTVQPWRSSLSQACNDSIGRSWAGVPVASAVPVAPSYCNLTLTNGQTHLWQAGQRTATPSSSNIVPATEDEFADAIASQSGWPSSSAISRALAEAADAGEKPDGPVTVTGPATSLGPKTTSTDSSGNVTERQTVYNYTYNGGNISYTTTVITTINGTQTTTETTEGEPPDSDCDGVNTVGCADLDTPETEIPKSTKNLTYAPEDLGLGGGSCPAPIPLNTSRGNWSLDLAPYCTATTTYVRPMVILVAMFIAYLIMTGHRFGGD